MYIYVYKYIRYLDFLKQLFFRPLTRVSDIHPIILQNLGTNRINGIADQNVSYVPNHFSASTPVFDVRSRWICSPRNSTLTKGDSSIQATVAFLGPTWKWCF